MRLKCPLKLFAPLERCKNTSWSNIRRAWSDEETSQTEVALCSPFALLSTQLITTHLFFRRWHLVVAVITTGAKEEVVQVQIWRRRGRDLRPGDRWTKGNVGERNWNLNFSTYNINKVIKQNQTYVFFQLLNKQGRGVAGSISQWRSFCYDLNSFPRSTSCPFKCFVHDK